MDEGGGRRTKEGTWRGVQWISDARCSPPDVSYLPASNGSCTQQRSKQPKYLQQLRKASRVWKLKLWPMFVPRVIASYSYATCEYVPWPTPSPPPVFPLSKVGEIKWLFTFTMKMFPSFIFSFKIVKIKIASNDYKNEKKMNVAAEDWSICCLGFLSCLAFIYIAYNSSLNLIQRVGLFYADRRHITMLFPPCWAEQWIISSGRIIKKKQLLRWWAKHGFIFEP